MQSARTITLVLILFSYVPLNFVSSIFCDQWPLYNFKNVQDMFIKFHTGIKHQSTQLLNMYF